MSLEKLTKLDFDAHLGSHFRVASESGQGIVVKLTDVTALGDHSNRTADVREPFSVVFCGTKDLNLPQGIYRFEHDQFGQVELFIVPIGPNSEGMCFEAVFN